MSSDRVALVCAGLGVVNRGFERFTRDVFTLLRDDFDVTLFKGAGPPGPREVPLHVPRRTGVLRRLGRERAMQVELAAFAARLLPLLRRDRFRVVHYTEPFLGNALAAGRRRLGLHFSLLLTDALGLSAASSRRADLLHVLTPLARDAVVRDGRPEDEVVCAPFGVDTAAFASRPPRDAARRALGLPPDARILLEVAAVNAAHKRIDVLVDEVSRLGGGEVLVVAGAPEEPGLVRRGRALLGERFRHFQLPPNEIATAYAAADVFVHAALEEGFCLAAVEAMAAGLPVVMHASPHFEWLVGDPRQLVDFRRPGALRDALARLPADAPERNERRAAELDWQRLAPLYRELYATALRRPQD